MIDYEDRDWSSMTMEHKILACMGMEHGLCYAEEIAGVIHGSFATLIRLHREDLVELNAEDEITLTDKGLARLRELDATKEVTQ